MNIKILTLGDVDTIVNFEKDILVNTIENDIERELHSWQAPWRVEALEHYLPLGWSFAVWEGEEGESLLLGYFLAQPLLFFKGLTQSLWVEHLQARTPELREELLQVAYKLSREKHFQNLLLAKSVEFNLNDWQDKLITEQEHHVALATSKIKR